MSARLSNDPLETLRIPAFRWFATSRTASGAAQTLLQAAMAWQVYEISGSAFQLGLIGLARFVPALVASLVGGAVADAYNRRLVILLSQTVPLLATIVLVAATEAEQVTMPLLYVIVFVTGLASSFENPARQALLPGIVPRDLFTKAITMNSTLQSLAFITGPAIGGGLIAVSGVSGAYVGHGVLVALAMASMVLVRAPEPERSHRGVSIAAIVEGISFVRQRPVLLGAMTLDMFAVIFGGAKALLPIYATDILQVGPVGYGVLSASLETGALLMSIALVVLPPVKRTGQVLLWSIAAFGLATMVFGISRNFYLSFVAYMAVGMADQVSVVMRITTIQMATPDALRGRVSAVNSVFVSASNQLGSVESGFVAAATSATFAVVTGGLGCLATVGWVAWRIPTLRRYRIDRDAEAQAHAAGLASPRPESEAAGG